MSERKYWIRKDRERYLLGGVIITCLAAGLITAHWHFLDRLSADSGISMIRRSAPDRQQNLNELEFTTPKMTVGATRYYSLGEDTRPSVPKLRGTK